MKFTTNIKALKILLKNVKPVICKDGILAFVKLQAWTQTLTATATNLKAYISQDTTAVGVETPGCCLVAHKQLNRILSKLKAENITFEMPDDSYNKIYLHVEGIKYTIVGADPEEFPSQTSPTSEKDFTLPANLFHSMLTKTIPFLGKDEGSGYTMAGISFVVDKETKSLWMLSTDGACATSIAETIKVNYSIGAEQQEALVPGFLCKALMNLSTKLEGACCVSFGQRLIEFHFDYNDVTVTARLLEGMFPQVDRATPEKMDMNLIYIDRKETIKALNALLTVEPSYDTCTMHIISGSNVFRRIAFIAENPLQGNVEYDVGFFSDKNTSEAVEKIYFNAVYLKTALETLPQTKMVEFGYQKDKPLMLFANNYFFLQMPCGHLPGQGD